MKSNHNNRTNLYEGAKSKLPQEGDSVYELQSKAVDASDKKRIAVSQGKGYTTWTYPHNVPGLPKHFTHVHGFGLLPGKPGDRSIRGAIKQARAIRETEVLHPQPNN